jgi:hypothetical protein
VRVEAVERAAVVVVAVQQPLRDTDSLQQSVQSALSAKYRPSHEECDRDQESGGVQSCR